jgi:hypothetical protein
MIFIYWVGTDDLIASCDRIPGESSSDTAKRLLQSLGISLSEIRIETKIQSVANASIIGIDLRSP